ncbi:MAG TPA: class I SAM-dependent methyltransferase [Acidimicrobiia bacterium]
MTPEERLERALSFGAIAEDYDRFRPGPPAAARDWLLRDRVVTAVEIGAGTGGLTRLLVEQAARVIAVEPDRRMGAVLTARVPEASVVTARAEALPVRDGRADALLGSSMWHWVDEERAMAEAARVLRPGGVLGLLWSGPDRSQPWIQELFREARRRAGRRERDGGWRDDDAARRRRHEVHLPDGAPFSTPETMRLEFSITVSTEQLVGMAGTFSGIAVLGDAQRVELRDRMTATVRDHPALGHVDEIELPMRCICWRAVRR